MSAVPSFAEVTEGPGEPATRAQLARMIDRYRLVRDHARGGRVLEVACGTGIGLRYLAADASLAVGGDIDPDVLASARRHGLATPLARLDAQYLPFRDGTFDVVCMAEAIYYVPDADRFMAEARRVLAPGGVFVITAVNPERFDFIRGVHTTRYLGPRALAERMSRAGFEVTLLGSFDGGEQGAVGNAIAVVRSVAARLNLIPGALAARAVLKRLVYGKMSPLPVVLDDTVVSVPPPALIQAGEETRYIITHAIGRLGETVAAAQR